MPVKADGSDYLAPIRLSDTFEVIGRGTDNDGIHYHIIRFGDNETCIVPRGDVGTSEGWRHLRNFINIPSSRRKLDLLTEHIQAESSKPEVKAAEWKIADVAGWHGNVYICQTAKLSAITTTASILAAKSVTTNVSATRRVAHSQIGGHISAAMPQETAGCAWLWALPLLRHYCAC